MGKVAGLGVPFESFGGSWGSTRTDPELARAWTSLPSLAGFDLRHGFDSRAFVHFRMGLRRDLSAWRRDALGLNLPLSADEVDINEPSFGYFHWEGDFLSATAGRFPVHWSPDPDFGLTLSRGVPYHNAVEGVLKMPRLRYRFLVSSLNPWLEGTPAGNASGTDYPVGSEQWRQRNYPVLPGSENAHKRVYDQPMKTLVAHRLEARAGSLTLGVTETNVIGGKAPDLRDVNPFAVFHNDFHEGYSNNNVSVDAAWRLPFGLRVAAEIFMDDLEWSDTESSGATPSLLGYLGSVGHARAYGRWALRQRLVAVYTDAFLYGFLQPLNAYTSRIILTSNDQRPGDARFVDKYVVDYPLGYLRGGDAFDLRYRAEAARGDAWKADFQAAWLTRGEVSLADPYEGYFRPHGSSPSGRPERELRMALSLSRRFAGGLALTAGAGWRVVRDAGHVRGASSGGPSATLGMAWTH